MFQGIFCLWSSHNRLLFTWSFSNMISFTNGIFRILANERCYFGRNQFTLLQSLLLATWTLAMLANATYQPTETFSFTEMYIIIMYATMFLLSYRSTCESLGELKKRWKHSPVKTLTAFLILPNFHLCFYNLISLHSSCFLSFSNHSRRTVWEYEK